MTEIKTALIIQGGGLRATFAAGAVYQLGEILGIKSFDIVIGISASAPTAAYFTSGQFSIIKEVWQNKLITPRLVKRSNVIKGRPIFDVDYLVDEILKKDNPLNVHKLNESPVNLFIPFYNFEKDEIEYYHNHQFKSELDVWLAMKSSMFMHEKQLVQAGRYLPHTDPNLISFGGYEKAVSEGATHFLIINNFADFKWHFRNTFGLSLFKLLQSRHFPQPVKLKLAQYRQSQETSDQELENFCQKSQVLLVTPPAGLKLSVIMKKKSKFSQAIISGQESITNFKSHPLMKVFQQRSQQLNG